MPFGIKRITEEFEDALNKKYTDREIWKLLTMAVKQGSIRVSVNRKGKIEFEVVKS
jgi:hypothetical protein